MKRPTLVIGASIAAFAVLIFLVFNLLVEKQKKAPEYYDIAVPEPSGLCFSADGRGFWTVSDRTGEVVQISFDGEVLTKFTLKDVDFEGITVYNDTILALTREGKPALMFVSTSGNVLRDQQIDLDLKNNSGLEGISFIKKENIFILAQEKKPRRLIEVDATSFEVKREIKIGKDFPDISDIWYDERSNQLWILSDQGEFVARCSRDGEIVKKHKLKIEKLEGVCVDPSKRKIYTVSDKLAAMFIFDY